MKKKRRSLWFSLLRTILLVYLGLAAFAWTMADRLIFFPPRPSYKAAAPSLVHFETTAGERIAAFYHPAATDQPTLLFSHGNAEDIGHSIRLSQAWQARGWGVLAYDYPGYGHSSGRPTEASCERAVAAAWDYLTETKNLSAEEIVVVGRSVGSGPSVYLTTQQQPAALILISPFTSTFAVRSPAQYFLPRNRFPNLKRIRSNTTPLLIIHGDQDRVIPVSHGQALHDASQATRKQMVVVEGAGHNNLGGPGLLDPLTRFIEEGRQTQ